MPGISMSSSATSGWCTLAAAATSSPRPTAATTSKSSQVKHHRERAPDQLLIVGEQQPDRHVPPSGASDTRSRHPLGCSGPASTLPPAAVTRSRRPAGRCPAARPPDAVVGDLDAAATAGPRTCWHGNDGPRWSAPRAPPSRTAPGAPGRPRRRRRAGRRRCPPPQQLPAGGKLAGEGHVPVAGHRGADLGERPPGEGLDLGDLPECPRRVGLAEPPRPARP